MAIFHSTTKIISRSHGKSAVAAIAYRSASKLEDERTGKTWDYEKKQDDLIHSEISAPEGTPAWMQNRALLWNHVERVEKRCDAQLAREIEISLPLELTHEQNIVLTREYIQSQFVSQGMIADWNIHRGHKSIKEQPHVHIMLSLRDITPEGFGKKRREWNDKALTVQRREAWAALCNVHLAKHGFDMTIDHRSYAEQGIHLEPQSKIGAKSEREQLERFQQHQRIAQHNGEAILKDPTIALHAITHQQSTFTHQDLARFVNRHTSTPEQFTEVYEAVKASPTIVNLGMDDKHRERFTTQEMLKLEREMVDKAIQLHGLRRHEVTLSHHDKLIADKALSTEQHATLTYILAAGDITAVIGFAGTGKSYLLGTAREILEKEGYQVQGMAMAGIAAQNLEGGSGIKSHTIANRLINWKHDREQLTAKDVVVLDEAGMVSSHQMAAIVDYVHKAGAKLITVGDTEQLQAIEAGAPFRAIAENIGFAHMTEVRRQQVGWQQQATVAMGLGKTEEALNAYAAHDLVHEFSTQKTAIDAIIEEWQEVRGTYPDKTQIILAYTRDEVKQLNQLAREVRRHHQELGDDQRVEVTKGKRDFAVGDRVYFLRNERSLGVKNGTLGTIQAIEHQQFTIKLDGDGLNPQRHVSFHLSDYCDLDHGYAATVYKSQSLTVDRSHVLASKYFDRHATYVALSRHREQVDIYWSRDQFSDLNAMSRNLSRERL